MYRKNWLVNVPALHHITEVFQVAGASKPGDLQLSDSIVNNPAQNGNVVLLNLSVLCFLIRLEGLDKLLLQTGQADPHPVL